MNVWKQRFKQLSLTDIYVVAVIGKPLRSSISVYLSVAKRDAFSILNCSTCRLPHYTFGWRIPVLVCLPQFCYLGPTGKSWKSPKQPNNRTLKTFVQLLSPNFVYLRKVLCNINLNADTMLDVFIVRFAPFVVVI